MSGGGQVLVPMALAALALVDGAFAGFRAATGRNARIDKRSYNARAARRGFAAAAIWLAVAAAAIGGGLAADRGRTYDALVHAGDRMLFVLTPFAALVVLSLAAYWLLPMRQSTFVIVVGLGPFTLVRPLVVAAAACAAVWGATGWLVWVGTLLSAGGVLVVEPWVHRRWYAQPC